MRRMTVLVFRLVVVALGLAIAGIALFVTQPALRRKLPAPPLEADPAALRAHVHELAVTFVPRDLAHVANLDRAADYILEELRRHDASAEFQSYAVDGKTARNVVARFGPETGEIVVVGAHYDAFGGLPGADDNASGTAGLLELARLLAKGPPRSRVELVAYTLEEPPYFGSEAMGSAVHARALARRGARVTAMIGLEMIGRFTDEKGTQTFPVPLLKLLYPTRGDFIAVAGRVKDWRLTRRVKRALVSPGGVPVRSFNAPPALAGTDLSDHANYWKAGYSAVMVTDTAFFRNFHYHTELDTPDRLDYRRMAHVVEGVYQAVRDLAG